MAVVMEFYPPSRLPSGGGSRPRIAPWSDDVSQKLMGREKVKIKIVATHVPDQDRMAKKPTSSFNNCLVDIAPALLVAMG